MLKRSLSWLKVSLALPRPLPLPLPHPLPLLLCLSPACLSVLPALVVAKTGIRYSLLPPLAAFQIWSRCKSNETT